jgi:hypothetical protein
MNHGHPFFPIRKARTTSMGTNIRSEFKCDGEDCDTGVVVDDGLGGHGFAPGLVFAGDAASRGDLLHRLPEGWWVADVAGPATAGETVQRGARLLFCPTHARVLARAAELEEIRWQSRGDAQAAREMERWESSPRAELARNMAKK